MKTITSEIAKDVDIDVIANLIPRLLDLQKKSETGESLTIGEQTQLLDITPRDQALQQWLKVFKPRQAKFWQAAYESRTKYYEAVATIPWGTRSDTAKIVKPQNRDLFIHYSSGEDPQLPFLVQILDTGAKIAIIGVDNNPLTQAGAQAQYKKYASSLYYSEFIPGDIENAYDFLSPKLRNSKLQIKRLRGFEFYGRYSPLFIFGKLLQQHFRLGEELGITTDFITVMLNRSFDPRKLEAILPGRIKAGKVPMHILPILKRGKSIMVQHGMDCTRELPVWNPEEIETYVQALDPRFKCKSQGILLDDKGTPHTICITTEKY